MRNRILGIVLALSLLAVAFPALNVGAAVYYTGSVVTTDGTGAAKDLFFRGDPVYVNVELRYQGVLYDGQIRVELVRTTDRAVVSAFNDRTNDPAVGYFNSSVAVPTRWLSTNSWFDGMAMVYDVVVYYTGGGWNEEIARTPITVKKVGIWMEPETYPYYPGADVTLSLVTPYQFDVLYVQIVNSTGATMKNWTNVVATDGWWSTAWTIPEDFPDGTFWINVRDAGTHAIRHSTSFGVQKYYLLISSDRNTLLPGEIAKISYAVYDLETLSPYPGVEITFSASYYNVSGNQTWINGTLPGTQGVQEFQMPVDINITSDVNIEYWANETGTERSYRSVLWLYTGELMASLSLDDYHLAPGETVTVHVSASVSWDELPGADVDIAIEWNGTALPAYGATDLVTNMYGEVTHMFRLDPNASSGTYIVNVTVSKAGFSVTRMTVFNVESYAYLVVSLDKEYYYSGDTVKVRFRAILNGAEVPLGYPVAFMVNSASGLITTGSTTSGEASFTLPATYYGWFEVDAAANIGGRLVGSSAGAQVQFASLVLSADRDTYRQGDVLTFRYQIVTTLETATLDWVIYDDDGIRVASGAPAFSKSGMFTFTVPQMNPSDEYTAEMTMRTADGALLKSSVTVEIMNDYELRIWASGSNYVSGEFKPGQKVTVHYSINTYTYEDLPVYKLVIGNSWEPTTQTFLVTEPTGSVQITVPSDAPTGWMFIYASLYDAMDNSYLSGDETMVMVNNELSAWDRSVGGMSAINFTLLILIIVMILLLIIVPFLKGRMGAPKAPQVKAAEPPPPAPPPSTP
ncbi:MAG: hypothetical protein QXU73_08625 [Thermoplasmata archaeon]